MKRNNMNNLKSIPQFKNEDEEAEFWATHDFTEYHDVSKRVFADFTHLKHSTQSITVRLPKPMLRLLKMLANEQDIPYQSLLKTFLDEKLKEKLILKQKVTNT
jgi:predicted DNA binding CopG/RHH family protein